jgi:hypothetical protein
MPSLETLTESDLRGPLTGKSLKKARNYVHYVQDPVRRGNTLTAEVHGTRLYQVEVDVESDGIHARCTCPYDWGGYCKHVGAVLLKWIQSPASFATQEATPALDGYPLEVVPVDPPPSRQVETHPFWLATSIYDHQQADIQQLSKWLAQIKLQDLRGIAKKRGWKVKGTGKADVARQVSERIADVDDVRKAVSSLDKEHRQVLRAMVLLGNEEGVQSSDIQRVAEAWGRLTSYQQIETYMRHLCQAGFALPGTEIHNPTYNDFVPHAIARSLPPILEQALPLSTDLLREKPVGPPSSLSANEMRLSDPYALARTASQITLLLEQSSSPLRTPMPRPRLEKFHSGLREWDYDPDEVVRAKAHGRLSRYSDLTLTIPPPAYSLPDETIRRLAPVAEGESRLEFIYCLLVTAGVFFPGSPVTVWPDGKAQFLCQDELTQRAILSRAYFRTPNWSALWELLRNQPTNRLALKRDFERWGLTPERLRADLVRCRHLVLRMLASLPDGEWTALEHLCQLMRVVWPRFDQTTWQTYRHPNYTGAWFLAETNSGKPLQPTDAAHWELAQGNFIRTIIAGPLHWLGLADLSYSGDELIAVRFHGLADLYWDRVETAPAPRHAAARAQVTPSEAAAVIDHHTITVQPSALSAQAHTLLDKIARLETATADRFVYQLDAQAVYETFESGATLSEILKDWEDLIPVPMTDAIQTQLTDWWKAYGQIRIYENLSVIEFSDEFALTETKAVTALEQYIIAEISPRLVIVSPQAVAPLMAELEKAGYTPKQTDDV